MRIRTPSKRLPPSFHSKAGYAAALLRMKGSRFLSAAWKGCFGWEAKMPGDSARLFPCPQAGAENSLPFIHTWKLERLFSSSSGNMWDYSSAFPAGGHRWKLALRSDSFEAKGGKSFLSLFLAVVDATSSSFHIEVVVELSILHEDYSQHRKRKVIHSFQQSKSEKCHPYLISLEGLECPSSGFLVAEIIDVVIRSEQHACFSCEPENNSVACTWKIDGFSKLRKHIYNSGPFLYNDHIWYLSLHPKGHLEAEDKSLSLYLYLDDASNPTSSVKVCAEYYFELVDQIKGKNYQYRLSHVFEQKSPNLGLRKSLSLDALHEPSRGFLVNDSCIIKVGFLKCDISK